MSLTFRPQDWRRLLPLCILSRKGLAEMSTITRRTFLGMAAALGATAAWGSPFGIKSHIAWRERRDLFPEGVASGDPDSNSVLLVDAPAAVTAEGSPNGA